MKKILYTFLLFLPFFIAAQNVNDTLFIKPLQQPSATSRLSSFLEMDDQNIMIAMADFRDQFFCGPDPELLFVDSTGDVNSPTIQGIGAGKVKKTSDRNFINLRNNGNVSNCSQRSFVISKFTRTGEILWEQERYYGVCNNQVYDVVETPDGGFAVAGFYSIQQCGFPFYNAYLMKFDANGEEQWVQHYGSDENQEQARVLFNTPDGGFAFLSYSPFKTYKVIKTDALGNEEWQTSIVSDDLITQGRMDMLPNGDLAVIGSFQSEHFLVRIDQNGVIQDSHRYPRARENAPSEPFIRVFTYLESIDMYFVATDHFYIIDRAGEVVWRSFEFRDLTQFNIQNLRDVEVASNGEILVIAVTAIAPDPNNITTGSALIRLAHPELLITNHEPPVPNLEMRLYPDPTINAEVTLDLGDLQNNVYIEVSNLLGQVLQRIQSTGEREIPIPLNAASGVYFVNVQPFNRTFKVIKR